MKPPVSIITLNLDQKLRRDLDLRVLLWVLGRVGYVARSLIVDDISSEVSSRKKPRSWVLTEPIRACWRGWCGRNLGDCIILSDLQLPSRRSYEARRIEQR